VGIKTGQVVLAEIGHSQNQSRPLGTLFQAAAFGEYVTGSAKLGAIRPPHQGGDHFGVAHACDPIFSGHCEIGHYFWAFRATSGSVFTAIPPPDFQL
jgi:hypothetical protein